MKMTLQQTQRYSRYGLGVLVLCLFGCSSVTPHGPTTPSAEGPLSVAIFPQEWMTANENVSVDARGAMFEGLSEADALTLHTAANTDDALASEPDHCTEELDCVRRVGGRLGASRAILIRLGELGDTVLVRATIVDVERGTEEETRQEVIQSATTASIEAAVSEMAAAIGARFSPVRPWYRHWWPWTIITAVMVGVGTTVILTLPDGQSDPDAVIRPPAQPLLSP